MSRETEPRSPSGLTDTIRDWCSMVIGSFADERPEVGCHGLGPAADTRVWSLGRTVGDRVFLKVHGEPRKFQQEYRCYTEWLPGLDGVPELLAHETDLRCLLLSGVDGTVADAATIADPERPQIHRQAGRFLRHFHDVPVVDADERPIEEALQFRLESWCELGRDCVDPTALAAIRGRFAEGFRSIDRRPVHHDYQPGNWLYDGSRVGVVDFEHAFLDHWLLDLVKLSTDEWVGRRDLEDEFLEGYGRELTGEDRRELELIALLHGLGTIVWGVRNRAPDFERHGRRILSRGLGENERKGE